MLVDKPSDQHFKDTQQHFCIVKQEQELQHLWIRMVENTSETLYRKRTNKRNEEGEEELKPQCGCSPLPVGPGFNLRALWTSRGEKGKKGFHAAVLWSQRVSSLEKGLIKWSEATDTQHLTHTRTKQPSGGTHGNSQSPAPELWPHLSLYPASEETANHRPP